MSTSILTEIIDTLQELKRLHQLNFELLEQLGVACAYFRENNIKLPNEEKILSLLSKAMVLIEEINSKPLSDEISQKKSSDKDFTEPSPKLFKRLKRFNHRNKRARWRSFTFEAKSIWNLRGQRLSQH
jgi:hypothetical protein